MKRKTFWSCTGCDKIYYKQGWGLKHLVNAHDGCYYLAESWIVVKHPRIPRAGAK